MPILCTATSVISMGAGATASPTLYDSLVFNGTSMLENNDYHPEISGNGDQYTIGLLVKVADVSNLQCIASFGNTNAGENYRTIGIDPNGGDPRFFGGSGATTRILGSTAVVPEVGKWYGITLTMDQAGNGQTLKVNGVTLNSTASDGNLTSSRSHSTAGICTLGGRNGDNDLFTGEVGMFLIVDNVHYFSEYLKWLQNAAYSLLPSTVKGDVVINLLDQDREWVAGSITDSVNSHSFPTTSGVTNSNDTIANGGYVTGFVNDGSWEGDGVADYVNLIDRYNPTTEIGTGDFSLVVRFKTDDVSLSAQNIVTWQHNSTAPNGMFALRIRYDELYIYFRRQGTTKLDIFKFTTTLANDTWYTVALARTGVTFDAWLNATDHLDENSTNFYSPNDGGLSIATDFNSDVHNLGRGATVYNGRFLDGHICQYAIFNNRILTADEVEVIHGGGVPHDLTTDRTYNAKTYTANAATLDLYTNLNTGLEGNDTLFGLLVNKSTAGGLIGVNAGGTWSTDFPS